MPAPRETWTVVFFCNDGLGPYINRAKATTAKQAIAFVCTRMDDVWPRAKRPTFRAVAFKGERPDGLDAFEGPADDSWLEDAA